MPSEKGARNRVKRVVGLLVVLLIVVVSVPVYRAVDVALVKANITSTIGASGQLHKTFTIHAMDNDREYPTSGKVFTGPRVLEQLVVSGLLTPDDLHMLLSCKGSAENGHWIYFEGQKANDPGSRPLLISPEIEGRVIVLTIGGSATPEPASAVPALIKSSPAKAVYIPVP